MPFRTSSAALLSLFLAGALLAAPPKVDYLYPAGAALGETVTVTAAGSFSHWPVEVWIDRPGLQVSPEKEKGKLKIMVAADARPGRRLLRLFDREGAATLRPFIVGTLPEVLEKEPNDEPDAPQKLDHSSTVNGRLQRRGDVDTFTIHLEQGQTLVASLRANTLLGSPVDAVLQVCSPDGFVLRQNDDEHGFDPQIVVQAPRSGTYLVRAFGFPAVPNSTIGFAGADNYVYRLTITTGGFLDHALPMAVARNAETAVKLFGWNLPAESQSLTIPPVGKDENADECLIALPQLTGTLVLPTTDYPLIVADAVVTEKPQRLELPCVVSGRLAKPGQVHAFAFTAAKGKQLGFRVESSALGYPLDPLLTVRDASGKTVTEVDDTGGGSDAVLSFNPPADGRYTLLLRDLHDRGGLRFVYRLTCEEPRPDFALTLAVGEFTLAAGKSLEIPVTIDRRNGFKQPIELTIEGLPAGVSVEPAVSQPTGGSAKSVKLKLTAAQDAAPSSSSIRINGRAGDISHAASFSLSDLGTASTAAWFTLTGK